MDHFDIEPEQVTITNQWMSTVQRGRDDVVIETNKKRQ